MSLGGKCAGGTDCPYRKRREEAILVTKPPDWEKTKKYLSPPFHSERLQAREGRGLPESTQRSRAEKQLL